MVEIDNAFVLAVFLTIEIAEVVDLGGGDS